MNWHDRDLYYNSSGALTGSGDDQKAAHLGLSWPLPLHTEA